MGKKTIIVESRTPMAWLPRFRVPWDDIRLRFYNRRRVIRYFCAITCRESLLAQLRINDDKSLRPHPSVSDLEIATENLIKFKPVFDAFNPSKADKFIYYFRDIHFENRIPNIYVNSDYLDREITERAIEVFLREIGDVTTGTILRFSWKRPNRFFVPQP